MDVGGGIDAPVEMMVMINDADGRHGCLVVISSWTVDFVEWLVNGRLVDQWPAGLVMMMMKPVGALRGLVSCMTGLMVMVMENVRSADSACGGDGGHADLKTVSNVTGAVGSDAEGAVKYDVP